MSVIHPDRLEARPPTPSPPRPRTVLVMAGGTGGHVYPALAVAEALRDEGWNIVWLATRQGMEAGIAGERGYTMAWMEFAGVRGKGWKSMLLLPLRLLAAFWQAARAIRRHKPDVAIGMGGYVAFPGGMMASLLGKPLVIHEQNAVAGLTNRMLACLADRVLVGLPAAFTHDHKDLPIPCRRVHAEWVGNPVRASIAGVTPPEARFAGRSGPLRLLVMGGSLGAIALNELVPKALSIMPGHERPQVRHQAGANKLEALGANYQAAGVQADCLAYIANMAEALEWADVVLCRAGASTISELAAAGVAAGLVPYPHAVDDHQTENARFLADIGAAWLLPQSELTPQSLAGWLAGLTREELLSRARMARMHAKPDATAMAAMAVKELVE